jgi:Sec-independent protein translocase protein TatA
MVATSFRATVVNEAARDATAFFREFQRAIGTDQEELDWVTEAWADIRRDFKLSAERADQLWAEYWKAFSEETVRLAAMRVVGE